MSYPPSGPSSPPPGGPYGGQQPSYGSYGGQPGHGHGGPGGPGYGGPGGPGSPGGPGGQGGPPRKGLHPGIIAAIAGVALLALLVCCLGGYLLFLNDDEDDGDASETTTSETTESETSEPTTESETSEPVTETETETVDPSSPSTPGGSASVDFPDSFDGWSSTSGSSDTFALYTKGGDNFNVIASEYSTVESYERIWDSTSTHGDISCGSRGSSGSVHCAGEKDGTTFLATSIGLSDSDLADALEKLLEEV